MWFQWHPSVRVAPPWIASVTLLNYMHRCYCGLLQSLWWCCNSQSFSSGIPVWAVSTKFFKWCSSVPRCIRWVAQWYHSVHWVSQWHSSEIPIYTGPASVHWLRVRVFVIRTGWHNKMGYIVKCMFRRQILGSTNIWRAYVELLLSEIRIQTY